MVSVVIPTYNAASFLPTLFHKLRQQTLLHELIIIDSESTDNTVNLAKKENAVLIQIKKSEFNHGTTRNIGLRVAQSPIVIYMTQDALPVSPDTLLRLVTMLQSRDDVAMAYGRQVPYPQTGLFGKLARLTNYPNTSIVKTKSLIPLMGIRTCSCSNSFAAYFKQDLISVGEFPSDTILGEDVSVAARFILQGKAVAYAAEAKVYHSHDYTIVEEFKRYFDIGAFHQAQHDVLQEFTAAESEGLKYVIQEWQFLISNGRIELIPIQVLRTIAKYAGYRLGGWQLHLPKVLKRKLSMHSAFWQ